MKIVAVIPAFNEEKTIGNIVRETKGCADEVLVINDGSGDLTEMRAREFGAKIINLKINRGLGSALRTGLRAGIICGADIIVTLDADGQHNPNDIVRLTEPVKNEQADVVIGTRMKNPEGMPIVRRIANFFGNLVTYFLFGIWVTDSQSGFRVFSRRAAEIIDIRSDRMEVSSEFVKEIKDKKLRLKEVSIKPVYTEYSLSKGQGFFVGLQTAFKLILRKIGK